MKGGEKWIEVMKGGGKSVGRSGRVEGYNDKRQRRRGSEVQGGVVGVVTLVIAEDLHGGFGVGVVCRLELQLADAWQDCY